MLIVGEVAPSPLCPTNHAKKISTGQFIAVSSVARHQHDRGRDSAAKFVAPPHEMAALVEKGSESQPNGQWFETG